MRSSAIFTAFTLSLLAPSAAWAHLKLTASTPATGTEAKTPKTVTLTFSMPVNQGTASAAIIMTAMPGMKDHGEMAIRNFTPSWSADGKTLTLHAGQVPAQGHLRRPLAGRSRRWARNERDRDVRGEVTAARSHPLWDVDLGHPIWPRRH